MKLSMKEKKVLYAFACPNHHNTVTRLKWLTALTVDPQAKHRMLEVLKSLELGDCRVALEQMDEETGLCKSALRK